MPPSRSLFPKYFLLISCDNSKHIRHVDELDDHKDLLVCDDEQDIASLHSRFQAEPAENSRVNFHIRCCYNNKYLAVDTNGRIYAGEKQPVEESSGQSNCTSFMRLDNLDKHDGSFRLTSVMNWHGVVFDSEYYNRDPKVLVLAAGKSTGFQYFRAIDCETLVALPRYVAFKGDNGKYLQIVKDQYLQFRAHDRNYESAKFEIITTPDGRIRVKNDGKFWRAGPNWIYCDSESTDTDYSDPNTLFIPYQIEKNVIALRNMDNNYFCRRLTYDYHDDCLCADHCGVTISRAARLEVVELVSSRQISNIRFREDDARYYDQSRVTMAKAFISNHTQKLQEAQVKLEYQQASTHSWTTSYSSGFTGRMGLALKVPNIIGVNFESSTQKSDSYEWGERKALVERQSRTVTVPIKPGKKVKIMVVATRYHCDIPFTYSREDRLEDGTIPNPEDKDGVYTGDYCINFDSIVEEVQN